MLLGSSCPSARKQNEDGIVLVDQERCGWRFCMDVHMKVYFNWKAKAMYFCYPLTPIEEVNNSLRRKTPMGR